jgi:hypothetical protein
VVPDLLFFSPTHSYGERTADAFGHWLQPEPHGLLRRTSAAAPMDALRWDAHAASVGAAASASAAVPPIADSTPDAYLGSRDELTQSLFSTSYRTSLFYDHVCARQHKHEALQRARRAGSRKGGKPLQVGNLTIF